MIKVLKKPKKHQKVKEVKNQSHKNLKNNYKKKNKMKIIIQYKLNLKTNKVKLYLIESCLYIKM